VAYRALAVELSPLEGPLRRAFCFSDATLPVWLPKFPAAWSAPPAQQHGDSGIDTFSLFLYILSLQK
jgi:hypothetical protein